MYLLFVKRPKKAEFLQEPVLMFDVKPKYFNFIVMMSVLYFHISAQLCLGSE